MYEIFGNFDSYEEINACADGLLEAGDTEHLKILAKENGIPEFLVESYLSGSGELTDWMNAALGKLEIEAAAHKDKYVPVQPVADYLKSLCMEEDFARLVRRRTKNMEDCMKYIETKTGELVRKGITYAPDLQVFHWARDYFQKEGEEK
ncbi:MAG: PcfK-like family protein [Dorea sp.]|nr:PcfK-like family protein [Dorea sp.]MDY2812983.1 Cas9 inhibitor AcrIIA9 family protein [Dorea sp.]